MYSSITSGFDNRSATNRSQFWSYPHPFLDLSQAYIPKSIPELYQWSLFLFLTHSEINSTIKSKCSYPLTDLVYDTDDEAASKSWRHWLDYLEYKVFEYKLLLDLEVFGNAFGSVVLPFDRYFLCTTCDEEILLKKSKQWEYKKHEFEVVCDQCNTKGIRKIIDKENKDRSRVTLKRWNPMYITAHESPFSGDITYVYHINPTLKRALETDEQGRNKIVVEGTPLAFLKAAKNNEVVRFDKGKIFHLKEVSASFGDDGLGIPPLLSVFKDVWLYQVYSRAQEAVAMDHVLPLRLLSPAANSTDGSPHQDIDLGEWAGKMNGIVRTWRRDQNSIYTVPFPVNVNEIGGEALRLNVHQDMNILRNRIIQGLQVPPDLASGNMNWSGSSVALRMLENLFIVRLKSLDKLLSTHVLPQLRAFSGFVKIDIHHRSFKMADDVQRQNIALALRQTNTVSDQSTLSELGYDHAQEKARKKVEAQERRDDIMKQIESNAEATGRAMILQAEYAARAQVAQTKEQKLSADAAAMDKYRDAANDDPAVSNATSVVSAEIQSAVKKPSFSKDILNSLADDILKSTPPDMLDDQLEYYEKANPDIAKAVRGRKASIKPLEIPAQPEQKPPRSTKAGI